MNSLSIDRGSEVEANGKRYVITHVLTFDSVMAQDTETGQQQRLKIADLKPRRHDLDAPGIVPDLSEFEDGNWEEARRRLGVIRPLLNDHRKSRAEIAQAAKELGVNPSTLYRWIRKYRSSGKLSSLLPSHSDGGRGKARIPAKTEEIIQLVIENFYLTKQQPTVRSAANEVARLCHASDIDTPHPNTVRARILAIAERTRFKRRSRVKLARETFEARPGEYTEAQRPLAVVQIDHTKLDIILVDEEHRLPIGRPWITLAFDVYSRMVVGYHISLDPPGAHGTGLCLANAILPKETWLARHNVTNEWPCWGFPAMIHLDNAKEFHGEMLRRACEQHGIEINFRPVATPHFGGHIERALGTLGRALHELPGTTFSSVAQRGEYDSEANAAMTLGELETWFAEYVTGIYHRKVHSALKMSPLKRWTDAILGNELSPGCGIIPRPLDEQRLRLDFMPHVERTIQTYGVRINEIHYYSDVLRPYINASSGKGKRLFQFRYDPRDISTIYFWDTDLQHYANIPYRDTSRPPMSIWELREIRRHLEESGKGAVDEAAIFDTYKRLRTYQESAVMKSKKARRSKARRHVTKKNVDVSIPLPRPLPTKPTRAPIEPFEIDDL